MKVAGISRGQIWPSVKLNATLQIHMGIGGQFHALSTSVLHANRIHVLAALSAASIV
jgi:hypothetical protein